MFIIFKNLNRTFALNKKTNNYKKHSRFFCQSNFLMMQRQFNNNFPKKSNISCHRRSYRNTGTNSIREKKLIFDEKQKEEEKEEDEEEKEKYRQRFDKKTDNMENCLAVSVCVIFINRMLLKDSKDGPEKEKQKDLDSLNDKPFECFKKFLNSKKEKE